VATEAPEVLWRLSGSLRSLLAGGAARQLENETVELLVSAPEASQGGVITIAMRVDLRCPACAGAGDPTIGCARCDGSRIVGELFSAWLTLPANVADGTVLEPSVLLPGMLRPPLFRVRTPDRRPA
jgi:hypothetical protein